MSTPHHKTRRRYEVANQTRCLTFSCYQRRQLLADPELRDIFAAQLNRARELTRFRLHAWVVMPEHIHLVLTPDLPDHPVDAALRAIKPHVAARALNRWRKSNDPIVKHLTDAGGKQRFWQQGGGYDRNLRSPDDVREKVNYAHQNPVRRGLAERPADWPWSSAQWYDTGAGMIEIDRFGA